jgi:peptidoglycan/LPS O-acetylase OafA/YrhL
MLAGWMHNELPQTIVVAATGCAIYVGGVFDQLHRWLRFGWVQFLGRLSYSLYLIHTVVGLYATVLVHKLFPGASRFALPWFFMEVAISIVAAYVFYRVIEEPSVRLSRRWRLEPAGRSEAAKASWVQPALKTV